MKKHIFFSALVILPTLSSYAADTQTSMWRDVETVSSNNRAVAASTSWFSLMPDTYRLMKLNESAMRSELSSSARLETAENIIEFPLPDGKSSRWRVSEDSIMAPELAAEFPAIKTYEASGLDEGMLSGRLSFTPNGLHAMLDTTDGTIFIDPRSSASGRYYISYFKHDYNPAEKSGRVQSCGVDETFMRSDSASLRHGQHKSSSSRLTTQDLPIGNRIRNYRLAVAATAEYTAFHGGVAGAMAAIATTINRVNQVYRRDVAVRMNLVANNSNLIFTNAATDGYTNSNGIAMLGQNQSRVDAIIGSANYDVGHVFSTGGGGVASLGVPCRAGFKARGVTGSGAPVGDPFDIDFVAHELGHQFGAQHTFNSTSGACGGGNRSAATAVEPGSGVTVMGYAGICGANNLQPNSIAMFSAVSIDEITDYTIGGFGDTCDVAAANGGNTAPSGTPGTAGVIPANTPFELTGTGSDPNGDSVTFSWEQVNTGTASNVGVDTGNNAILRPFLPTNSPTRTFPKLSSLLNNSASFGEKLPSTNRPMNFQLIIRDGRGGVSTRSLSFSVRNTGQVFSVTSQNAGGVIKGGQPLTFRWNVAGTRTAPVNCSAVNIKLSLDGGNTYPIFVARNTANDGSHSVVLPGINTGSNRGRIKVKCSSSIFFDINNTNLLVQAGQPGGGGGATAAVNFLLLE